jgi:hypothetical protein
MLEVRFRLRRIRLRRLRTTFPWLFPPSSSLRQRSAKRHRICRVRHRHSPNWIKPTASTALLPLTGMRRAGADHLHRIGGFAGQGRWGVIRLRSWLPRASCHRVESSRWSTIRRAPSRAAFFACFLTFFAAAISSILLTASGRSLPKRLK